MMIDKGWIRTGFRSQKGVVEIIRRPFFDLQHILILCMNSAG
jgi:hypothetical protein